MSKYTMWFWGLAITYYTQLFQRSTKMQIITQLIVMVGLNGWVQAFGTLNKIHNSYGFVAGAFCFLLVIMYLLFGQMYYYRYKRQQDEILRRLKNPH